MPYFKYVGSGDDQPVATVTSRVSGASYEFELNGDSVEVSAEDAAALSGNPHFVEVSKKAAAKPAKKKAAKKKAKGK